MPDKLPAKLATLALPLGNGVEWAYLQGKVGVGECIVIQGPGQQGLACVVAAKEAGAGCDHRQRAGHADGQRRLALAKRLGAHHTINVEEQDLLEAVVDITGGAMADLVIDCASGGPWTVVSAIHLARKGGRILIGGRKGRAGAGVRRRSAVHALPDGEGHARPQLPGGRARPADHRQRQISAGGDVHAHLPA